MLGVGRVSGAVRLGVARGGPPSASSRRTSSEDTTLSFFPPGRVHRSRPSRIMLLIVARWAPRITPASWGRSHSTDAASRRSSSRSVDMVPPIVSLLSFDSSRWYGPKRLNVIGTVMTPLCDTTVETVETV